MDPKNLSQLDPKLREAYERVMGVSSPQQQASAGSAPMTSPITPTNDPQPMADPAPHQPQQPLSQEPSQPNPIEPIPTVDPAPSGSSPEQASPSVFGVDVPPPPPPPMQAAPIEVPPPPPPPPSVAQNDPTYTAAVPPQTDSGTSVHAAKTPMKIMPVLIVVASLVFLLVWGFFWIQILLK